MLKKKMLIIILSLVTITTIVGLVAFSYAWYLQSRTEALTLSLEADGFLIITFDEDIDYSETILTPAVAITDAVKNNEYMNVLTAYNENDATPSYIQTVATVANYGTVLNYYNADETVTTNEITIICEAKSTLPDGTEVSISLEREITLLISVLIEDADGIEEDVTISPVISGEAFSVPSRSVIGINLSAYISLPDELCDRALNEGVVTITITVTANSD